MFTKEQLEGILLTVARPEVTIYNSERSRSGYTVRVRIMFRAKRDFLIALQRRFEQLEISCILRDSEGVNRDKPVLIVGQKGSIDLIRSLMPKNVPCSHSNWTKFDIVTEYLNEKLHLEDNGMERLIEMIKDVEQNKD